VANGHVTKFRFCVKKIKNKKEEKTTHYPLQFLPPAITELVVFVTE
jgi:hypothetical protein